MSLLHKSAPLLCATGVVALAFGAAALIIDANTPAQATVTPKAAAADCGKVLAPEATPAATQYLECLFPYGYNPQIR